MSTIETTVSTSSAGFAGWAKRHPLVGSLMLGLLHAFWHFPAYFIPGTILPGPFDLSAFIGNSLGIIVGTILWTWVFNNARGSILIAMLVHGVSNAASGYIPQLLGLPPDHYWASFKIFGVCALLVIVLTRGRLSYKPLSAPPTSAPLSQARASEA